MSAKNYFLVTVPHLANSIDALKANTQAHQQSPLIKSGAIRAAGGQLPPGVVGTNPDAPAKIQGSWAIIVAENAERIWEMMREDAFWQNKVWDTEKISIVPILVGKGNFD